jgi:glycosyltransferase involved in cell wall biosynthesis
MHIVFLTNEYPAGESAHGGIGSFVQNLARNLVFHKIHVSVVGISTTGSNEKELDNGVEIHRIKQSTVKLGKFIFNSLEIRKKLKIIHAKNPIDLVEGSELSFAFLPKNTPYKKVIRMHGGHYFFAVTLGKKPALWRSFQEITSFKKADALIAVSDYVGETTKELVHFKLAYTTIHNFIDVHRFKNKGKNTVEHNSIVFIGTICEKKGVKQLVEAFPLIKEMIPTVKLHLVGRDWKSKEIKSYTSYIKTLIASEHLNDIIFHGSVSYEDIPIMLEKAQVCVYPSHMESFGLTLVEAMAMEKPIVFSAIPPFKEIITDTISGVACNPLDATDIAEKILLLLKNKEFALRIGIKAREAVLEKFEIATLVKKNIQFYKSIV